MPTVEVDDEVWEKLKARAEPFVDTPNSVLRRLLKLSGDEGAGKGAPGSRRASRSRKAARRGKRQRAPVGSLLPEAAYELPILRVIAEHGGSAAAREVVEAVGKQVHDQLRELDLEELSTGGQRWENRVQFTRLRLRERGLIATGSPRGIWEITDAGRAHLQESEAS